MAIIPTVVPMQDADKTKILDILKEKGVQGVCPMCGNKNLILMDGYFTHPVQGNLNAGVIVGGPAIPSVAVVCTRCGFMSHHALGALGLLPPPEGGGK
ncbi:MAG: hypothetical protein WAO19_07950 [Candidatus Kryptoniota bacterium]